MDHGLPATELNEEDLKDIELLGAVRAGNQDAFLRLYDRHAQRIYTFGLRVLRSAEDAEELLTDVFMRLWERSEQYDPGRGVPAAWLFTVARSRAIDMLRARQRRRRPVWLESDPPEDPAELVLEAHRAAEVNAALARLTRPQREVLDACYFRGLSQSEAAAELGLPLGTVKTRARSALFALRANLGLSREVRVDAV